MSLKEEIYEILNTKFLTKDKNKDINKLKTDLIIVNFEKRIEPMYVKHPNLAGIAHNECLDQIKKEVLK